MSWYHNLDNDLAPEGDGSDGSVNAFITEVDSLRSSPLVCGIGIVRICVLRVTVRHLCVSVGSVSTSVRLRVPGDRIV